MRTLWPDAIEPPDRALVAAPSWGLLIDRWMPTTNCFIHLVLYDEDGRTSPDRGDRHPPAPSHSDHFAAGVVAIAVVPAPILGLRGDGEPTSSGLVASSPSSSGPIGTATITAVMWGP